MNLDLCLLERWTTGWSLSCGVPLPRPDGGGLVVEVGLPEDVRRHVFVEAGDDFQACASHIQAPFIFLKAAVEPGQLRRVLPAPWHIAPPGYLMYCPTTMATSVTPPAGYVTQVTAEHGATVLRFVDATGQTVATGRVVLHGETAVFDRIETIETHRRKKMGTSMMLALDALAIQTGVSERLLSATEAGRVLYPSLGWRVVAPWSTSVLPAS